MLSVFVGVLYTFLGSFHEKSRSRHALRRVLFFVLTTPRLSRGRAVPSRGRGSESVGSSSEREMTRGAYVGMPREPLETPNEDDTMPWWVWRGMRIPSKAF